MSARFALVKLGICHFSAVLDLVFGEVGLVAALVVHSSTVSPSLSGWRPLCGSISAAASRSSIDETR